VTAEDGFRTEVCAKFSLYNDGWPTYIDYPTRTAINFAPEGGLCPNVFFEVGIRRQAMSEECAAFIEDHPDAMERMQTLAATKIMFGGSEEDKTLKWCLSIPYQGAPALYHIYYDINGKKYFQQCEWTEGSLAEVDARTMATGLHLYKIGVAGDSIIVSDTSFDQSFASYQVKEIGQPIIPAGDIVVDNWPGQCAISLALLRFDLGTGLNAKCWRSGMPVGRYAAARVAAYGYGFSLKGYEQPSGRLVWPRYRPAWWPEFYTGIRFNIEGGEEEYNIKSEWPPNGPPGEWPAYSPYGWPPEERWPPYDPDTGETRPCPEPVPASFPYISGGGVTLSHWPADAGLTPAYLTWQLEIEPVVYDPGAWGGILSYSTPYVQALSLWQIAKVTTNNDAPGFTDLPPQYVLQGGTDIKAGNANVYELSIDNRLAVMGTHIGTDVRIGATIKLWGGFVAEDESIACCDMGERVLVEKPRSPRDVSLILADYFAMLNLFQWDLGDLNFRDWPSDAAIRQLLNYAGLATEAEHLAPVQTGFYFDLEYLGLSLRDDSIEGNRWVYQEGDPVGRIIADIAHRGQALASVWHDYETNKITTGCPYCRTKRTPADYLTHLSNGWNSPGCIAADLARATDGVDVVCTTQGVGISGAHSDIISIEVEDSALRAGEFANRITTTGHAPDGSKLRLRFTNNDSLWPDDAIGASYLGWPITHVEDDTALRTWGDVFSRQRDLMAKLQDRHQTIRRMKMPLSIIYEGSPLVARLLRAGMVIKVYGMAGMGDEGTKFRVLSAQHIFKDMETSILAREMIGPNG